MFLTFSDGAKFAIIARNLVLGKGYVTDFSFWGEHFFRTGGISPLVPNLISVFMRLFGVYDFSVILFSSCFYLLLVFTVYLLGKKLFGNIVGILSAVAVAASSDYLDYAMSGASEPLFAFEIALASYFVVLKNKWANVAFVFTLAAMYFSRPQAFIYIGGLIFFWLILNLGVKKGLIWFFGLSFFGLLTDKFVIYPLSFKYPVTPVITRGLQSMLTYTGSSTVSNSLRGSPSSTLTILDIIKKAFYTLYNFYKLLPQILNPYLWTLFIIGLLRWGNEKLINSYKLFTVFITLSTFLVVSLSIPFFRYLHPIVPFVYILAVENIVWIMTKIFNDKKPIKFRNKYIVVTSSSLIIIFSVGLALGKLLLDSRFEKNTHNMDKPPVYVVLSEKLRENTNEDDLVLTNLDTWGSWYGERRTVWYPLTVSQFDEKSDQFDAIYLTSYKKDDDNYYMGDGWRQMFDNPQDFGKWECAGCGNITDDFMLKEKFEIPASGNYENEIHQAILLVRK